MSGRGFYGTRRDRTVLTDDIQGVNAHAIRRLARCGGVKRISGIRYEEDREYMRFFLEKVIGDFVTYSDYARANNVTVSDVVFALKCQGHTLQSLGS